MKYDDEHIKPILESLSNGDGRVRACKIANITHDTFMNWMNQYSEFSDAVKKAEYNGNSRIKDLQQRKIIEDKSWQSAAWWLERNFPEEFAQKNGLQRHVVMNVETEGIDSEILKQTGEELINAARSKRY